MLFSLLLVAALSGFPDNLGTGVPHCRDTRHSTAPRCWVELDLGGEHNDRVTVIGVDNASTVPNAAVADMVMAADRSTMNGSPRLNPVRKGLMASGDRVCVTDRYIAWFDYSMGDGTWFNPRIYRNDTTRAGGLAGIWTLDPETHTFRYPWPSPDNSGDFWAPNELIPGSASPNGEQYWWDPYGPPTEHTLVTPTTADPQWDFFLLTYEYAKKTPRSNWQVVIDGARNDTEVTYVTSALMTSWRGTVDVLDGEDDRDIKNSVQAEVTYLCRPEDIVTVWDFRPTKADIPIENLYVISWMAYAAGIDGTPCDQSPEGNQWPGTLFNQPRYATSSEPLRDNWDFTTTPAGRERELLIHTPPCDRRNDGTYPDYHNNAISTAPDFGVGMGSWMQARSANGPGLRFIILDEPLTGEGTKADPERIGWHSIDFAHEQVDGTYVLGPASTNVVSVLKAGRWYRSTVAIQPLP